jgi:hypothetical protein
MKNTQIVILGIIIVLNAVAMVSCNKTRKTEVVEIDKIPATQNPAAQDTKAAFVIDAQNCTYIIDNEKVVLVNGKEEKEIAPDSASKKITKYRGKEAKADLDNNDIEDVAVILTQNSGGSGTFYYVAVAIGSKDGCQGTNAILLGDRIWLRSFEVINGEIIVTYNVRKPGEPFTAGPSVEISKHFKIENGTLVEIPKQ